MILKREEKENKINAIYDSSNVIASTYDTISNDLIITFKSGSQYKYTSVSKSDYMRFEIAESQGSVFNSHIKKYSTTKLDSVDPSKIINESIKLHSEEKLALFNGKKQKIIESMSELISIEIRPKPREIDKLLEHNSKFVTELEKLKIEIDNFIKEFKI